jgi:LysR family transcriptional regulator for bpeEF and oprC
LRNQTCIAYRRPRTGRLREWRFRTGAAERVFPVTGPPVLNSIELLIQAAEAGLGIIQVPECYAMPSIDEGALMEVLREHRKDGYQISAAYLPRQRLTPKIRVFMEFLTALFDPPPWADRAGERVSAAARRQGRG